MNFIMDKYYNTGKIAQVYCAENEDLENITIKNKCFLLLIITQGEVVFNLSNLTLTAIAPCLICFNESDNPVLIRKKYLQCSSVYFHPQFLNVNMSFEFIRSEVYEDVAHIHDMFLLKPFLDGGVVIPIPPNFEQNIISAFYSMKNELENQHDWYWSCRGRSYFIELVIAVERIYGIISNESKEFEEPIISERVNRAILYIETNYKIKLTLEQLAQNCGTNRTTINKEFKKGLNITPIEYLWIHRIKMAKKLLAFTNIPLKDLSIQCGFATTYHFSRIFKEQTGKTPAQYRKDTLDARKTPNFLSILK